MAENPWPEPLWDHFKSGADMYRRFGIILKEDDNWFELCQDGLEIHGIDVDAVLIRRWSSPPCGANLTLKA